MPSEIHSDELVGPLVNFIDVCPVVKTQNPKTWAVHLLVARLDETEEDPEVNLPIQLPLKSRRRAGVSRRESEIVDIERIIWKGERERKQAIKQ